MHVLVGLVHPSCTVVLLGEQHDDSDIHPAVMQHLALMNGFPGLRFLVERGVWNEEEPDDVENLWPPTHRAWPQFQLQTGPEDGDGAGRCEFYHGNAHGLLQHVQWFAMCAQSEMRAEPIDVRPNRFRQAVFDKGVCEGMSVAERIPVIAQEAGEMQALLRRGPAAVSELADWMADRLRVIEQQEDVDVQISMYWRLACAVVDRYVTWRIQTLAATHRVIIFYGGESHCNSVAALLVHFGFFTPVDSV